MSSIQLFQDKSVESLDAASLLVKEKYYTTSVHAAYYACYQMMLSIEEARGLRADTDEAQVQDEYDAGGSHKLLQNKIWQCLYFANKQREATIFKSTFHDLKTLRHKADYQAEKIIEDKAKKAIEKATQIIALLKQHFIL